MKGLFWVIVLCFTGFAGTMYSMEIYLKPGAGFYQDAAGLNAGVGIRGPLAGIIRMENPNFFTGLSYGLSYAGVEDGAILNHSFSVDFGYDFILPALDEKLSIAPVLKIGGAYGDIKRGEDEYFDNFGFAFTPLLEAKFAVTQSIKLGLSFGYPMLFIYEGMVNYIDLGAFFSYSFK
jgi:hypothetical protein